MLKLLWFLVFGPARPTCSHVWALVTDREFPAKVEDLTKHRPTWTVQQGQMTTEFCQRTYYAILKCDKCGGVREFVAKS